MENLKGLPLWYGVFLALFGLALVAAGYRLMRLFVRVSGALIFGAAGLLAAAHFHLGPWPSLGIAAGAGLLGFLSGNVLYYVNVSLNGAAAGYVIASAVANAAAGHTPLLAAIVGMLLGAILAVCFERPIGIFGTSVVGGALVATGLSAALASAGAAASSRWLYGALLLLCAVGGCVLQARTAHDLPPSKPEGGKKQ